MRSPLSLSWLALLLGVAVAAIATTTVAAHAFPSSSSAPTIAPAPATDDADAVAAQFAAAYGPDFDVFPMATPSDADTDVDADADAADAPSGLTVEQFGFPLPRQTLSVTLARVTNPWPYFDIFPGVGSGGTPFACRRANTSTTAVAHGCAFATNAGFFDMATGACLGNVVSDAHVLETDSTWPHTTFGTAFQHGRPYYVIGYYNVSSASASGGGVTDVSGLQSGVSGMGWLVRQGVSYLNASAAREGMSGGSFLTEIAPRTAIGFDGSGALLVVVVDGEEDIKSGATLYDMVALMLSPRVGAVSAMNLDGGGSTVAVEGGRVISKPTCVDTPRVCERAVTTVTCVRADADADAKP